MQPLESLHIFGLKKSQTARQYFESLIKLPDWKKSLDIANNSMPSPNGAGALLYADELKELIVTDNVIDLLKQEKAFWLMDIMTLNHRKLFNHIDFYVVWLIKSDADSFIIFDDGNYQSPIACYELMYTDFGNTANHNAMYFIVENSTVFMNVSER